MTPPSGSTATDPNRGRAYLFADSPAVIHDPMDKLTAGLDGLSRRAGGRDIQRRGESRLLAATQNRLRAQWEGVERARREYPAMRVR